MLIEENKSLKEYNTFNLDVTSRYFFSFNTVDQLKEFAEEYIVEGTDFFILGGGSNILFTMDSFKGFIIHPVSEEISLVIS